MAARLPGAPKKRERPASSGRKPRTPNKLTRLAKDNIVAVFNLIGGVESMARWARMNRTEFYKLYARLIPVIMDGGEDGADRVVLEYRFTKVVRHEDNREEHIEGEYTRLSDEDAPPVPGSRKH